MNQQGAVVVNLVLFRSSATVALPDMSNRFEVGKRATKNRHPSPAG